MKPVSNLIADVERSAVLPPGNDERFSGYGVMSLPFTSGYVLALRRFPVTSVGPGYTSVWMRTPSGSWSIFTNVDPSVSCPRYFGSALDKTSVHDISISWLQDRVFTVRITDDVELTWEVSLAATPVTRGMSVVTNALPEGIWRNQRFLRVMGAAAGPSLRAGRVALVGRTPNKQSFWASPKRIWFVDTSTAKLGEEDLGSIGPLPDQTRLGDFWMPQRGIFMVGSAAFDILDPTVHSLSTAG